MKHFKYIKQWCNNQLCLFYFFIGVLIIPNLFLFVTEEMSLVAKICNVILPLSCYWFLMSFSKKSGKILWLFFPFIFFGAFQLVLLYLFGESIIAVDMFLNLTTTNSNEAFELLDNLWPALIGVFLLYIPTLVLGLFSILNKNVLTLSFLYRQRKYSLVSLFIGLVFLLLAYKTDPDYQAKIDLYPLNVCYNVYLAMERNDRVKHYLKTSEGFTFEAKSEHGEQEKEIYIFVIGETSRALNWGLYGYERNTTPILEQIPGVITFKDVITQSNTTHKSVPILLSAASAENFDCIYRQKGMITAFKEAGFYTVFFSNQRYNNSFIDFFGKEADEWDFIKEDSLENKYNPSDDELLERIRKVLDKDYSKLFIVLHTYGSHFNYKERYPLSTAEYKPDNAIAAEYKYREELVNAYDNTIRYTDYFLAQLILMLDEKETQSGLVYISDHGEDIYDDERQLFLHASPIPSYYQLHVPFLLWMSNKYQEHFPEYLAAAKCNSLKPVSSNSVFHTVLSLGGIDTRFRKDSLSVVSRFFTEKSRFYLNDHNLPKPLNDIGLKKEDFYMFKKMNCGL